jgi:hypothetical protein
MQEDLVARRVRELLGADEWTPVEFNVETCSEGYAIVGRGMEADLLTFVPDTIWTQGDNTRTIKFQVPLMCYADLLYDHDQSDVQLEWVYTEFLESLVREMANR